MRALIRYRAILVVLSFSFVSQLVWGAKPEEVSIPYEALSSLRSKQHPRSLPAFVPGQPPAILNLIAHVEKLRLQSLPLEPGGEGLVGPASVQLKQSRASIQATVFSEEDRILVAALVWRKSGNPAMLAEARRRATNLASWSAVGPTSFPSHDQAGRSVAWTLSLAYDWLYDQLTAEERKHILAAVVPRVVDMLAEPTKVNPYGLDNGRTLDKSRHDSHGAITLARLAVICTVLVGEDPIFDQCYQNIIPRYLSDPIPWGGDDGGYANGTSYAHWDMLDTHFIVWDLLKNAIGVDLWQRPWAKQYINYIAYFLPPGSPLEQFGDAAEEKRAAIWATQAKAHAQRMPSTLADWYARNQFGEQPFHLSLLLGADRDFSQLTSVIPSNQPTAIHIPSIGWVAMHSNLGDRTRTSIYFKSSPFGSYNHSHADQNSITVYARGQPLAIDSGYYDFYNSPHWKGWYKQTRAHNAITFDGGQGQLHDTLAAKGKITHFEHHSEFDITTGDATDAYGGALSRAVRSVIYLRPYTVLVFDSLASGISRSWEWNIHALSRMKETGERHLEIAQEGVRLCVSLLEAPEGTFTQADTFTAEPQGKYPQQWHARFASRSKSLHANFLALLDVECHRPEVVLTREKDKHVVRVHGQRFVFVESGRVVSSQ